MCYHHGTLTDPSCSYSANAWFLLLPSLSLYHVNKSCTLLRGLKHSVSALRQGKLMLPPRNTRRPIVQLLSKHLVSSITQFIFIPCQKVLHSTPGLKHYMSALRQGKLVLPPRKHSQTHRAATQQTLGFFYLPSLSLYHVKKSCTLLRGTETLHVCPASRKACVTTRNTHRPIVQLLSKHLVSSIYPVYLYTMSTSPALYSGTETLCVCPASRKACVTTTEHSQTHRAATQ